jgi:hypothetical protein
MRSLAAEVRETRETFTEGESAGSRCSAYEGDAKLQMKLSWDGSSGPSRVTVLLGNRGRGLVRVGAFDVAGIDRGGNVVVGGTGLDACVGVARARQESRIQF